MKFYGLDRERTVANCDSQALGRAGRAVDSVCGWNRIRPEHVVELLDQAGSDVRGDARDLAVLLSRFPWRVVQGTQAGTSGNRIVNNVREIEVSTVGRNFRLHCVETPALRLERVTA